ncbi:uncharacterized protein SCHCODRAFT_02573899 [Schizophyllum commune H4-8]|nr:uncharacterized protein SCHCODRAFT_02573899 [Schizophyllum commune H4-8]KAI5895866.1 hypothetical protein SCHCODRAFT_02573899 [Schizophyllum commune H4-8]
MPPAMSKDPTQTSAVTKRKKPPACDYCKARRVICHPQPDGKPCPRCVEKEVVCTTTPTVRRKPQRRHADNTEPTAAADAAPSTSKSCSSGASQRQAGQQNAEAPPVVASVSSRESTRIGPVLSWRDAHPLPAPLIEELIKVFPYLPQSQLPIVPYHRIHDKLEACGWNPSQLDAHSCVLAHCIVAVTARVSTHPMLIGADVTDTQLLEFLSSGNLMITPGLDLRELGRRRDTICRGLHDEACWLAREAGITIYTSEENAASCYLLDFLESSTHSYDSSLSWSAAMMWHVRALAESEDHSNLFSVNYRRLHWPVHLFDCALLSIGSGRSLPFTEHDERLICGLPPIDIETATITLATEPLTGKSIGEFIYPFLSHVIKLVRSSSENLVGPYARRQPLDEAMLTSHLCAVEALQKTCVFLHACIESAIPRVKRNWARPALANGLFITSLAVPGLLIPLHRELKRRLAADSSGGGGDAVGTGGHDGVGGLSSMTGIGHALPSTDYARRRLELLQRQVRALALRAVVEATRRARDLPSLPYMTHLQNTRFEEWLQMLVDESEGCDISPLERYETLERIADLFKLDGFAWVERSGAISLVESEMAYLQAQHHFVPHSWRPDAWADEMLVDGALEDQALGNETAALGDEDAFGDMWEMPMGDDHTSLVPPEDFLGQAIVPGTTPGMVDDPQMLGQSFLQADTHLDFTMS